jgi:hypothetical protein
METSLATKSWTPGEDILPLFPTPVKCLNTGIKRHDMKIDFETHLIAIVHAILKRTSVCAAGFEVVVLKSICTGL